MGNELTVIADQLKEMNSWGYSEWISLSAVFVSFLSIFLFVRSLNETRYQNFISNSIQLKDSYKSILDSKTHPSRITNTQLQLIFKEDAKHINFVFNTLISSFNDSFLQAYLDFVDFNFLKSIINNSQLTDLHKYELIVYFGVKYKLEQIGIEECRIEIIITHPFYQVYTAYKKELEQFNDKISGHSDKKILQFITSLKQ